MNQSNPSPQSRSFTHLGPPGTGVDAHRTFGANLHIQSKWDKHHESLRHTEFALKPHEFATSIAPFINPETASRMNMLELGCGMGSDAAYFASMGLKVTAVDISDVALQHNQKSNYEASLVFQKVDISQPLQYAADSYDVVYAHLSLHYFDLVTTDRIFAEIARVLKPEGMLYFACESTSDPEYGEGVEIEPGVFTYNDGHTRHFFSVPYTEELVTRRYDILRLEEAQGMYHGQQSSFIYCWAKKRVV